MAAWSFHNVKSYPVMWDGAELSAEFTLGTSMESKTYALFHAIWDTMWERVGTLYIAQSLMNQ